MTSIIRLCPLSGGLSDSEDDAFAAHCYLLEVDQYTFLLDCGWDSKFSPEIIQELKRHVHKVCIIYTNPCLQLPGSTSPIRWWSGGPFVGTSLAMQQYIDMCLIFF